MNTDTVTTCDGVSLGVGDLFVWRPDPKVEGTVWGAGRAGVREIVGFRGRFVDVLNRRDGRVRESNIDCLTRAAVPWGQS